MTDHLARARDYIARGDDYYFKAAEEIRAWLGEDGSRTREQAASRLGKSRTWVSYLLSHDHDDPHAPFGGPNQDIAQSKSRAKKALRDPELRREVIDSLEPREVEAVAEQATNRLIENARARRAEHITEPTADDLMGGERFDPAEYWADTLVIRVNRNARELAHLVKRAGGLLFGTMPPDEAFDYLHEAERLIAEARAAAQEQVRDAVEV